jgi:hypothetical protein
LETFQAGHPNRDVGVGAVGDRKQRGDVWEDVGEAVSVDDVAVDPRLEIWASMPDAGDFDIDENPAGTETLEPDETTEDDAIELNEDDLESAAVETLGAELTITDALKDGKVRIAGAKRCISVKGDIHLGLFELVERTRPRAFLRSILMMSK